MISTEQSCTLRTQNLDMWDSVSFVMMVVNVKVYWLVYKFGKSLTHYKVINSLYRM